MLQLCWIYFTVLLLQAGYFNLSSSSITKLSPCACEYNGHIYNLSSLAKKDGPRFTKSIRAYKYAYNPCIPFTQGDSPECQKVAICYWSGGQMHEGIGFQDDVYCQVNKGNVELIFRQRGSREGMISTVQLKCNRSKILVDEAEMDITVDKAEPILEVEHKCCCPDGCPADIPTTLPTTLSPPTTLPPPSTVIPHTGSKITVSSSLSIVWIAVAASAVFIVVFLILIGLCCLRRRATPGHPGIIFPVNFERGRRPSRQHEVDNRRPDYGAVRGQLLIPPPPYGDEDDDEDDVHDDNNDNGDETRREGVEHEEKSSEREDLPLGVPEDGFTSPVQVSERISK